MVDVSDSLQWMFLGVSFFTLKILIHCGGYLWMVLGSWLLKACVFYFSFSFCTS